MILLHFWQELNRYFAFYVLSTGIRKQLKKPKKERYFREIRLNTTCSSTITKCKAFLSYKSCFINF